MDEQQEAAQDTQQPEPKRWSKLWIILPLGFVFVILGGALGAYLAGAFSSAEAGEEEQAPPEVVNKTFPLEAILIQLADTSRKPRYVRLSVTLGIYFPEDGDGLRQLEDVTGFQPRVQDRLIFAIGSKTSSELTAPGGRQQLKDELLTQIRSVFPQDCGKLKEVFITELLIQ